jgi:putative SOS response-associated peptidase YedK
MCGRFTLTRSKADIREEYQKRLNRGIKDISKRTHKQSYNITPSQEVAVIYYSGNQLNFDYHQWGLVPRWSKDRKNGNKMINARVETIAEKPSFREAFFKSRCLIIADGYYEWIKSGKEKSPYYFLLENHKLFAFAGIRAIWQNGDEIISSCSIITTDAAKNVAHIHSRMPIILSPKNELDWIFPESREKNQLFNILEGRSNDFLIYYQVSRKVNNPSNNSSDLIKREDKELTLF